MQKAQTTPKKASTKKTRPIDVDPAHFFFDSASLSGPLRRKGIYILPNLFTLGSLFAGFYGIVAAIHGEFIIAAVSIFIAMIFDSLDGRVARLINAQSAFGAEFDSLTDMVCFGVGTGLIVYHWTLVDLKLIGFGKIGWLCAFLYVACVALRLARFNTTASDKRYFQGLPCPSAAGLLMAWVWFAMDYQWGGIAISIVTALLCVGLAFLMVSSVPYRSFKDLKLNGRVKFAMLSFFVLVLMLLTIWPAEVLLLTFGAYALSGVYVAMVRLLLKASRKLKMNVRGRS
jgi:CDP-diacylglycerol--serine O-phosphatidyltransferase